MSLVPIRTALVSVSDKTGLLEFIQELRAINPNIRIIASGGTAQAIGEGVTPIEEITEFPECFEGRVKTLNPKIAGGILFKRGLHDSQAQELGIDAIDLVVCNLYNFSRAAKHTESMEELVESVDIGGSTLIRAAAKNYKSVGVVVDPTSYSAVIEDLKSNQGSLSLPIREQLAAHAMNHSADYDGHIAEEFSQRLIGMQTARPKLVGGRKLRYGENPDQEGWVYHFEDEVGVAAAKPISGKELSYNNLEDAHIAYNAASDLKALGPHGCAIIKHGSLCAYATGKTLEEAFERAWAGDSKSAFGSVIAFTSIVDESIKELLSKRFVEVIIAPGFQPALTAWLREKKPNLRILKLPLGEDQGHRYRSISGGMLVQSRKQLTLASIDALLKPLQDRVGVATSQGPEKASPELIAFAISAVSHAKSNAIVLAREYAPGVFQLVGVGAGQPNRIDSLERLAIPKAVENIQSEFPGQDPKEVLKTCVMASDGFFPFADSVEFAAQYGIMTCIQPGGAKRDSEVIEAADKAGMCMILTGERYFNH